MERIFIERPDFHVIHEPFSILYYVSEGKGTTTPDRDVPPEDLTYPAIRQQILKAAENGPVFIKDMPYHAFHHIKEDRSLLDRLTHSFLIRHPAPTLASHYAKNPDLTLEEAGYDHQYQLLEILKEMGKPPLVIEASQLTGETEKTIKAYCKQLDIPFIPEALQWEQKTPEDWKTWSKWHQAAGKSQGIEVKKREYRHTVDNTPRLAEMYHACLPLYEKMRQHLLPLT